MRKLKETMKLTGVYSSKLTATLLERTETKAIYQRTDGYYEVFYVMIKPESVFNGSVIQEREHYPTNEDFGKIAWCIKDRFKAFKKYNSLIS